MYAVALVRVRITRPRQGEIDGVDLSQFEVGIAYNLPRTLAAYLVLTQSAEAADDAEPDRPETMLFRGIPPPPDIATDLGSDEEFIDVVERVCDTAVTASLRDALGLPRDIEAAKPQPQVSPEEDAQNRTARGGRAKETKVK